MSLQSIVRVVFHERRLQYMEKAQLDVWKLTRPGERIVDIGIVVTWQLLHVKFMWDS